VNTDNLNKWLCLVPSIGALLGLSACAEFADVMLSELEYCGGCDWIVQEWDDGVWNTHNSDPYETEEICEQALADQSRVSPDRGHRCVYEGDLPSDGKTVTGNSNFCYGCDWVVEVEEYGRWQQAEAAVYHTEGVCQQASWHLHKEDQYSSFRCTNLDE